MSAGSADVVVVGAGVLGVWTAFHLRQRGVHTLLVDAWEPGHLRGSSSGESRVIRFGYGARRIYTRWAWEALAQWKHWQEVWGVELYHRLGVLWLFEQEDEYTAASLAALEAEKIPVERIAPDDWRKRFPQISAAGIGCAYLEPEGGALLAERSVRAVVKAFMAAGGEFRLGRVEPPGSVLQLHESKNVPLPPAAKAATHPRQDAGYTYGLPAKNAGSPLRSEKPVPTKGGAKRLEEIRLADGTRLAAGSFVFACGPWLPQMFPAELGNFIRVTRQEVFWFGVPAGDTRFSAGAPESGRLPAWLSGEFYGIPALEGRGFKLADTGLGPPFDPNTGERVPSAEGLARAREYLTRRFPEMKYAPLVEARVCQYESTRDGHLLIDRHPRWENVWLVGGGSGHSFKLGPKVGEVVAGLVTGETPFDGSTVAHRPERKTRDSAQGRPVPPEELRLRSRPASPTENPAY